MTDIFLSSITGGGGLPKLITTPANSIANSRIRYGEVLASLNVGIGLTTVLDITEKGVISFLVLGSSGNTQTTALGTQDQVKITIDDVVTFDGSVTMAGSRSAYFIGSFGMAQDGIASGGSAVIPFRTEFNSLKVEIDNTSGLSVTLFGDARLTQ